MAATAPTRPSFAKRFSKWIDNISPSSAAIGFALVGIGILIGGSIDFLPDFWTGTSSNLGVEFISIAITVIVIDRLNKREAQREKRAELIVEMGSQDNGTALRAIAFLREYGWLEDGSLAGRFLFGASLQGANLIASNLQNANMMWANLQEAFFMSASLQSARLTDANLRSANLVDANLQGAFLADADLRSADMTGVNLQGVDMTGANLQGAELRLAKFDQKTTLPDETVWTPDTDMERFTNPDHPNFWRSDNPESPAYRGE